MFKRIIMRKSIPCISDDSLSSEHSKALLVTVSNNNWKEQYPYTPTVEVSLRHDGKSLHLNFEVEEEFVAAVADKDNGEVYKDSCVEFFISFDDDGYYNLEANCTGKILLSHRRGRKIDVEYASSEILSLIKRAASLGDEPFECRTADSKWYLNLTIPCDVFFRHDIKNFSGIKAKCNIYKCGDNLPVPHFLSWQPIKTANPDFHRPEFFGDIEFE